MKLVKSFTTLKKRQLLLEPQEPSGAAANDDDDDDDGSAGRERRENFRSSSALKRSEPEYHSSGQQMDTMCQRKSAPGSRGDKSAQSSRRKSELASFLAILFGVLLLAGTSKLVWAQADGDSEIDRPNKTSSDSGNSKLAPVSTSDEDVEDDEGDTRLSPATKLTDVLADTARDGADLLLNHLQNAKDRGEEAAQPEERDINETSPDDDQPAETAKPQVATSVSPSGPNDTNHQEQDDIKFAMDTYAKWRTASDDLIELFSRKLMPVIIEHGYDVDAGTVAGVLQVFNGIRQLKPWALKLLDAWAKLSPGILRGTQSDFGDFDECINIRVDDPNGLAAADGEHFPSGAELDPETGLKSTTLVGRYCLADVEFPKPPRVRAKVERGSNSSTSPTWPFEPIELRRPLLDFAQHPAFKGTIFVETGNFFHMLYVDPIRVGLCLTNKIDPMSFQQVFNKLLEEFHITINFRGRCVTKYDKKVLTTYQQISLYVLMGVCSLVTLSTFADLFYRKINKFPWPRRWISIRVQIHVASTRYSDLFTSFSLIRNTEHLFRQPSHKPNADSTSPRGESSIESSPSIGRRSSAESTKDLISLQHSTTGSETLCKSQSVSPLSQDQIDLKSLHGIRVITMAWMIVNHTYMFGGFFVLWAYRRLIDIAEWPKSLSFQLVLNGWLTVETYFFLSAMIIVLGVMPLLRSGKFNYFLYIFHRLIRLLPAYVGLVCLNFLWPLISSGPVWLVKGKSFVQDPCEQYLWTNFLFINNWFWPEKQCMVHTWFLSADFQLYLVAPIIVYLFYRKPALGHWLNLVAAVLASVLSGFVIYSNRLLPTTLINKLEFNTIKQQLSYSYFATYQHAGPYCLGLLVGYLLHKRPQVQLPKYLTWSLWLLLPPLSITTLLLTYLWNGAYPEDNLINPSPAVSALYVAIHRTIWSALLAWLVFACATGRARLLSSFLSNGIFLPLSRLSYSIYLVHLPVIMFRALNLRHTIDWTDQNILWESCGNFAVSSLLGYFLYVAFESPVINLERIIFKRDKEARLKMEQLTNNKLMMATNFAKNLGHRHLDKHMSLEPSSLLTNSPTESQGCYSTASSASDAGSDDRAAPQNIAKDKSQQIEPTHSKQSTTATAQRTARESDDLYNITGEYRHYAPGSYTQWRRARGQPDVTNVRPHRQQFDQPASSNSMRTMQYATLARANRPAKRITHSTARHLANDVEHRLTGYQERWDSFARSQDYANAPAVRREQHDLLFPNSSELGLSSQSATERVADDTGQMRFEALGEADLHVQRIHRRQGRYNTLTGGGARDWSPQSQQPHIYSYDLHGLPTLRSSGTPLSCGPLLIPRVDWPTSIRRTTRGSDLVPAGSTSTNQQAGARIVEEEANEMSAL